MRTRDAAQRSSRTFHTTMPDLGAHSRTAGGQSQESKVTRDSCKKRSTSNETNYKVI